MAKRQPASNGLSSIRAYSLRVASVQVRVGKKETKKVKKKEEAQATPTLRVLNAHTHTHYSFILLLFFLILLPSFASGLPLNIRCSVVLPFSAAPHNSWTRLEPSAFFLIPSIVCQSWTNCSARTCRPFSFPLPPIELFCAELCSCDLPFLIPLNYVVMCLPSNMHGLRT